MSSNGGYKPFQKPEPKFWWQMLGLAVAGLIVWVAVACVWP